MLKLVIVFSILCVVYVAAQECKVLPPQKNPFECCNDEIETPSHRESLNKLAGTCLKIIREKYPSACQGDFVEKACVIECVGETLELTDKDGYVKGDEMKKFIKSDFSRTQWVHHLTDEVVDKCLIETATPREPGSCGHSSLLFTSCAFKNFNAACPNRKDTNECKV